jgi:HAD superfamily hydrolase (TIGR01490 family)
VVAIAQRLSGTRFFITGSTGFLGTALVERILRTLPDASVAVLIRPTRRLSATDRAQREILKNDCFDRLRSERGDRFDEEIATRVFAVAGDVGLDGLGLDEEGRAVLAKCDVVIHSAAAVSFDAPLDQAVEINLLGPTRVADALVAARRTFGVDSPVHFIAVSTAYVAGTHQGEAAETLLSENRFSLDVDWRAEVTFTRRLRDDLEARSRESVHLSEFADKARIELGPAGEHLLAARAEKFRDEWVKKGLVDAGTARSQSLGWPDAYPFTKAMGERALIEAHGIGTAEPDDALPISIVRPSIIESSLAEPVPGWIRGFRMAEPIIVSYARGLLREFPGVAEGVIDVIPVDMVVAAILAVAANGADPSGPTIFHVASGVANPLRYGRLVELVQEWFSEHPIYDEHDQPISPPDWSFPGRGRVQRQLSRATQVMDFVERFMGALPVRGERAQWSASLEERNVLAKRALSYVELYGAYTETEARYRVDRLMELWDKSDAADHATFCFNPKEIDWNHYVSDVHLPSIAQHARLRMSPGRSGGESRRSRAKKAILAPERHLAAFDLENTVIAANVVDSYAWLASRHLDPPRRARFVADLIAEAPSLLALDRRDRGDFLRSFYRRYEGAPLAQLEIDAWQLFHTHLLPRAFPAGLARVRKHRQLGHRTVCITGALDFVVAPLAPLFDDIICAHMGSENGRLSGKLDVLPPIGEARAQVLAEYADAHNFDLAESVAYADSASDLAMLEVVGYPVAVNPEAKLASIARRRGWHVEHWPKAKGGAPRLLPLGPFDVAPTNRRALPYRGQP